MIMYIMYELHVHVCVYVWTNIHLIVLIGGVSLLQVNVYYKVQYGHY